MRVSAEDAAELLLNVEGRGGRAGAQPDPASSLPGLEVVERGTAMTPERFAEIERFAKGQRLDSQPALPPGSASRSSGRTTEGVDAPLLPEPVEGAPGAQAPLAVFTIPGDPAGKKNSRQMSWPSIAKMKLTLTKGRPVRGLKDLLFLIRGNVDRGNQRGASALLGGAMKAYPVIQPSKTFTAFARRAHRALLARTDLPRPLPRPKEHLLRVDADFYLATGSAGRLDHPGLLEAIFDVLEDEGLVTNDFWLTIGHGTRIWPPAGRSKAALAALAAWRPRVEVRIYPGGERRRG